MGKNETIISLSQDYCDIPKNASKIVPVGKVTTYMKYLDLW